MGGKSSGFGRRAITLAGLVAIGFTQPALAGSFSVNPVQLSIPNDRQVVSLTIKNNDTTPVSIQVQTLAWTQTGGKDQYSATTNVIVSPPIFTLQPGKTQLVRIGLKDRKAATAYRVILEEIPKQRPVDGQIQVTLRLNLPLYILPKGGGKSDVSWRAWREQDGSVLVEGRNQGNLHQQIIEIEAQQADKNIILTKQMGVVLPGSSRTWKSAPRVPLNTSTQFLLIARSAVGVTKTRIPLEQR